VEESEVVTRLAVTYPINISGVAGDATIRTVAAGLKFKVMGLWLRANGAEVVTFKSGTTAISGPITLADTEKIDLQVCEVAHMSGRETGEDFVITTGTGSVQLSGWASIAEER